MGLIVFPLKGHCGYGVPGEANSENHYIHHARFTSNFGSSAMWDVLMGTDFKGDKALSKTEVLRLVLCKVSVVMLSRRLQRPKSRRLSQAMI